MNNQDGKTYFHIDVNSAFLSWEAVELLKDGGQIDLRTIPSVVGGDEQSRRGIVLAKSTPAKRCGIITGEPLFQARKKCPQLTVVPARHKLYEEYSAKLFQLLGQYSPSVWKFSIDEAFLDYTGMENLFGEPVQAAYQIKGKIQAELGFTVNIGIAHNKLLAKMAGELSKPNKVHTLWPEEIATKMWPLPVEELFMAGRSSVAILKNLGVKTIGDLAHLDPQLLEKRLKSQGRMLWNYANGIEKPPLLTGERDIKGISNSLTTPQDVRDLETAHKYLLYLTEKVATRLRNENLLCNNVSVGLKNSNFKSTNHQRKLSEPTDLTSVIYTTVKELFQEMWLGEPLRLLEVRLTDFISDNNTQLTLFTPPVNKKMKTLDDVIDKIRQKDGHQAIQRASLLPSKPPKQ